MGLLGAGEGGLLVPRVVGRGGGEGVACRGGIFVESGEVEAVACGVFVGDVPCFETVSTVGKCRVAFR